MKSISIIIPTFNAGEHFEKLLMSLKMQSVKEYELIIIDSSSLDTTVEIAKKYTEKVIIIPKSEFDHGGTRTMAAKISEGEILIYLTQDILFYDYYSIENIIKEFNNLEIAAAYGRQISYKGTNIFGKHLREFNYKDTPYIRNKKDINKFGLKTAFLSDSFAAYRKKNLQEIGYFKNGLILGEDTYVGAKMILKGYSLSYVSEAKVYHSHSYTILQEFRRYFDIGVFHAHENWILENFGKAEGEGFKYIKSEMTYIIGKGFFLQLPSFIIRNFCKYLGYKLGENHKKIHQSIIKNFSMHQQWWEYNVLEVKD